MSINPESLVDSPTALTSTNTGPRARINPACNSSPTVTSIGTDSPVRGDLSSAPKPSITLPSAGINSPLRISITSPILINSKEIISCFSVTLLCLVGWGVLDNNIESGVGWNEKFWISVDLVNLIDGFNTLRAVFGILSRPTFIKSLAFSKALLSR